MWKCFYTKTCCQEMHITLTVLSSESCTHMLRDYTAQKQWGEKTSSIYSCVSSLLGLHVQHQSIRSRKILHSQHASKQRDKHAQYTFQRFLVANRVVAPQLSVSVSLSFFMFSLSFPFSLSTCVICQSLISMSWRHLYSRQTQSAMCWWLSAVAIYHLSSFCPLRR